MQSLLLLQLNLKELLLGQEDWPFLIEIVLRTVIMFLAIIFGLRLLGKRGVKQLSVFELVVIIGLGSAAGDPMFYKEVGIVSSLVVFVVIIFLYSVITFFIAKSKNFEKVVEGKPMCLIKNGEFSIGDFRKENFGIDEFFAELRINNISHLGQVEEAIVEISGEISIFFYDPEETKYGLPIMPDSLDHPYTRVPSEGHYSCIFCGNTELKTAGDEIQCGKCGKDEWVQSSNKKRIS
ncbi:MULTISPECIES: DUF421 domain-containing protein [Chryseobacterium]|uniref:Uncharacterized membrane protein YcaP (DUF421 family) n=1 Tax=Chryseobacterium camelliae TaxID=1265445 RepID=A0ABU0TGQ1_9FLAO|nr:MULTISPECIES: YetF domain-containing protein [Chryseobacterium]MDT3405961.1 uncharacterized membrane protein YcaP (DUF421 family) [Pseudacidovorax intermedius]MDQ1096236.1 uncharacterized membrane protein YcaP (DUF421 family) [Chryseobacterium camelliae]MDQ1100173.1 uncharacterized membrane protein YcaP (DUF421 family) [Chryseobacterium sp. SORGH_AS_1048]MDR6087517.1 uncharacterized membrane protein YcaP (DUF421 family) [Chryseobacterium sp. SORGH_AS_0909]MDR6131890.1 uncharacterized membra